MSQLTFQLDKHAEDALQELKEFFRTDSNAAAIRASLALARAIAPCAAFDKRGRKYILVLDQRTNTNLKIILTN